MEPATITEPAILLCINQVYRRGMSAQTLYDAIRGVWAVGEKRSRVQFAFGVVHGKIVEVYQIQQWHQAGATPYTSGRVINFAVHASDWEFTGAERRPRSGISIWAGRLRVLVETQSGTSIRE